MGQILCAESAFSSAPTHDWSWSLYKTVISQ